MIAQDVRDHVEEVALVQQLQHLAPGVVEVRARARVALGVRPAPGERRADQTGGDVAERAAFGRVEQEAEQREVAVGARSAAEHAHREGAQIAVVPGESGGLRGCADHREERVARRSWQGLRRPGQRRRRGERGQRARRRGRELALEQRPVLVRAERAIEQPERQQPARPRRRVLLLREPRAHRGRRLLRALRQEPEHQRGRGPHRRGPVLEQRHEHAAPLGDALVQLVERVVRVGRHQDIAVGEVPAVVPARRQIRQQHEDPRPVLDRGRARELDKERHRLGRGGLRRVLVVQVVDEPVPRLVPLARLLREQPAEVARHVVRGTVGVIELAPVNLVESVQHLRVALRGGRVASRRRSHVADLAARMSINGFVV
ncbi:hypothetical protein BE08_01465 [Sorangium cellulosum]|uniref:Uncharacterized protein n=1 Tax=Sorangium cellulosum TaxID=56 RepID=A0A150P3R6_SORCE|nr:hypothetical protein BE08_01465 [Sorangium cellulosum]